MASPHHPQPPPRHMTSSPFTQAAMNSPLPFNPNAHHFNSAMNNVGFGFGGAGGGPKTPAAGMSSGFARFGSTSTQGSSSGFGFGGRSNLPTTPTPTASSSSVNPSNPFQGETKSPRPRIHATLTTPLTTTLAPLSTPRRPKRSRSASPPTPVISSGSIKRSRGEPDRDPVDDDNDQSTVLGRSERTISEDQVQNDLGGLDFGTSRRQIKRIRKGPEEAAEGESDAAGSNNVEDLGVLLASLPPSSLLPLIHSLLAAQPELKPTLLRLIPTPEIEDVLRVLRTASKAVQTSVPMGRADDGLVGLRIRQSLAEFCTAALTYLPRFIIPPTDTAKGSISKSVSVHPTIPPTLLIPLSQLIASSIFPLIPSSLTVSDNPSFVQLEALCDKILLGWKTWLDRVGAVVNVEGGMFSVSVVRTWIAGLDELVSQSPAVKQPPHDRSRSRERKTIGMVQDKFAVGTREIRDGWVDSVGWMVGRSRPVEGFDAGGEDVKMG